LPSGQIVSRFDRTTRVVAVEIRERHRFGGSTGPRWSPSNLIRRSGHVTAAAATTNETARITKVRLGDYELELRALINHEDPLQRKYLTLVVLVVRGSLIPRRIRLFLEDHLAVVVDCLQRGGIKVDPSRKRLPALSQVVVGITNSPYPELTPHPDGGHGITWPSFDLRSRGLSSYPRLVTTARSPAAVPPRFRPFRWGKR
jgi:hypothetical protein